jgi:hypothetical protein
VIVFAFHRVWVVFPCHATDASVRCAVQICFTYHPACFLCKVFVVLEIHKHGIAI